MRRIQLTALAAATILSVGLFANRAEAMTLAAPSALGVAGAHAAVVRQVAVVCGTNGCAPVQVSHRRRPGTHP